MDRFERFNLWFSRVIDQLMPVVWLVLSFVAINMQLPLVLAAFAVGWGALIVFSVRRRVADIELASLAYLFLVGAVTLARS